MSVCLALDPSKTCTGFALWYPEAETARYGSWTLGSAFTSPGMTYAKVHRCLSDLHKACPFDVIAFEEEIHPAQLTGSTNIGTIRLAAGIASHIESFAYAKGIRSVRRVNVASWRRDFIGPQKRGTKRITLKQLVIERCRQLGFAPRNDNEADAIGILDYSLALAGIVPPWREAEVLRPMLGAA